MEASYREIGSEIVLAPFGDVQVGAPYAKETCKRYIDKAMEAGAKFIGMGDYVDVTNPSSRRALRSIRMADTLESALREKAEEHVEEFLELVKGTEWIGLLSGHHYFDFEDGTTSDSRIARALRTEFWKGSVWLKLGRTRIMDDFTVLAFHGDGSSGAPSGALRKLESVASGFEADICLMGHHHKLAVSKRDRLWHDGSEVRHTTQTLVCTGSYVKGYVEGQETYVERKMMVPVTLGGALIYVKLPDEVSVVI